MKTLVLALMAATLGTMSYAAQTSPVVPKTMRAVAIDQPGGPEVLKLRTLPVPTVDANEVLIALHSASVATWDIQIRRSLAFIQQPKFPYVLGSDGAGTVAAVGRGVTRFKVGDAVYGYCWDNPKGGFYAEYVAASSDCISKLPKGVPLEDAGALGASGLTALSGVDRVLHIQRGETVIIHGGSGAVGTLALQLAKLRGARVLATASGDEGIALVRRLGPTPWSMGGTATSPPRLANLRRRVPTCCSHSRVEMRWKNAWMRCAQEDVRRIPTASNPPQSRGSESP